ncbi:Transcriptional activator Myb [Porphyridium purpureum]|uniref:Transcriptional activator Myb n=1 Tax=Porphyridium purpureum TaxID=35688 RepID=A0A5J4YMN4_PORPP|nr:Transcriptional activator Myb [Porphyridium purpureum]|eukprot:POR4964..scf295_9
MVDANRRACRICSHAALNRAGNRSLRVQVTDAYKRLHQFGLLHSATPRGFQDEMVGKTQTETQAGRRSWSTGREAKEGGDVMLEMLGLRTYAMDDGDHGGAGRSSGLPNDGQKPPPSKPERSCLLWPSGRETSSQRRPASFPLVRAVDSVPVPMEGRPNASRPSLLALRNASFASSRQYVPVQNVRDHPAGTAPNKMALDFILNRPAESGVNSEPASGHPDPGTVSMGSHPSGAKTLPATGGVSRSSDRGTSGQNNLGHSPARNSSPGQRHRWTQEEDKILRRAVAEHGARDWSRLAEQYLPHRNCKQLRARYCYYLAEPEKRDLPFSEEQDRKILEMAAQGDPTQPRNWRLIAEQIAKSFTIVPSRVCDETMRTEDTRKPRAFRSMSSGKRRADEHAPTPRPVKTKSLVNVPDGVTLLDMPFEMDLSMRMVSSSLPNIPYSAPLTCTGRKGDAENESTQVKRKLESIN